jgi:hypothetical protein
VAKVGPGRACSLGACLANDKQVDQSAAPLWITIVLGQQLLWPPLGSLCGATAAVDSESEPGFGAGPGRPPTPTAGGWLSSAEEGASGRCASSLAPSIAA